MPHQPSNHLSMVRHVGIEVVTLLQWSNVFVKKGCPFLKLLRLYQRDSVATHHWAIPLSNGDLPPPPVVANCGLFAFWAAR